jgi:hypothetical protein
LGKKLTLITAREKKIENTMSVMENIEQNETDEHDFYFDTMLACF